LASKTLNSNS